MQITISRKTLMAFVGVIVVFLLYRYLGSKMLISDDSRYSYTLGNDVAQNLIRQGLKIDSSAYIDGFKDGLRETSKVSEEEKIQMTKWAQTAAQDKLKKMEEQKAIQVALEIEKIKKNPIQYEELKRSWAKNPNDPNNPFKDESSMKTKTSPRSNQKNETQKKLNRVNQ